jgi:hypothetical protein
MTTEYEYSFIHRIFPLEWYGAAEPSLADFRQISTQWLDEVLAQLARQLPAHQNGGWEAISHDLIRFDRFLLVTVFLRRQKA